MGVRLARSVPNPDSSTQADRGINVADILNEMRVSLIKHFLDLVISTELRRSGQMSGYDLVKLIHGTYDILISPGTVYSILYTLERRRIIAGEWEEGRRIYTLTEKGEKIAETIMGLKKELLMFVEHLLENPQTPSLPQQKTQHQT